MNNLLSAHNKHVGSRSTDAHREQMERDSMVNDISFIQKEARNVHCHSVAGGNTGDINLTNLSSAYNKHVGCRSTHAYRGPMERDSMVNDISFFSKRRATCMATLWMEVLLTM